ncbi:hypothetical protein P171DRAFT_228281 [Karstenula rhodostoma CBS 690.94]|uniref:Uncharacterized protein n=1 Tax=Karstenula rhodostoma CBS 690.94 TaxID=1392251 RepID=A0A9P4UEY9_9PLEO|nr:hypothetical protein P171DRAFT_228281 [Karstenula rhodostoma CBS 690.94]
MAARTALSGLPLTSSQTRPVPAWLTTKGDTSKLPPCLHHLSRRSSPAAHLSRSVSLTAHLAHLARLKSGPRTSGARSARRPSCLRAPPDAPAEFHHERSHCTPSPWTRPQTCTLPSQHCSTRQFECFDKAHKGTRTLANQRRRYATPERKITKELLHPPANYPRNNFKPSITPAR